MTSFDMLKHFNDISSFDILKEHSNTLFRPKSKSILGIHDLVGSHNFLDTSSEICQCDQGVEDIIHFLFSCPFYVIHRSTLLGSVINILQKTTLVGSEINILQKTT